MCVAGGLAVPGTHAAVRTSAAASAGPTTAWIDVAVATVWTTPAKPRPVDHAALGDPVDIGAWLRDMTVVQRRDLTGENATQTQALYGGRVTVLARRGGWDEIAVAGQPTPKNPHGYPGWVPARQVTVDPRFGALHATRPFALVERPTTMLHGAVPLRISYDTRLPVLARDGARVTVATPGGGRGWLAGADVHVYRSPAAIPTPTGAQLVAAARMFLGRPYLWGGASGWAFDCSGLTHTIYDAHGITIGRDADAQADFSGHGVRVARDDLTPGDIIFYASDRSDPSTIYHDALYAGHGKMIEAYGAGVPIRITRVRYGADYWGAERFLAPRGR